MRSRRLSRMAYGARREALLMQRHREHVVLCPDCGGLGYHSIQSAIQQDCETCNGAGYVTEAIAAQYEHDRES